jgi:tRNA G18 (ribose-2'-O)-methylase SpoU
VLENIRSGYNVGSVFRSADAFLVQEIIICGYTAKPPHKEILKTALGATESVEWKYFEKTEEAILFLKSEGFKIFAIEQADKSMMLHNFSIGKKDKIALIFGNEVEGVMQETINHCDGCIEVEQYGTKHSLNISVCAGVAMYDVFYKMESK